MGGGNLRVILVRVCGPVFLNYPNHLPSLRKNDLFIYLIEQNVHIFVYCFFIFIYPFCCLQINVTILVSELNIFAKI